MVATVLFPLVCLERVKSGIIYEGEESLLGALVDSWYHFLRNTTPYGDSKPRRQRSGCSRLPLDHRGARIGVVCLKEHKITVLDGLHRLYERGDAAGGVITPL